MTDAYEILGVPRAAGEDEIKSAYRELAKKYHPDNFAGSPDIARVAEEKMREVNEAYDTIIKEREAAKKSGSTQTSAGAGSSAGSSYSAGAGSSYSNGRASSNNSTANSGSKYSSDTYSTTTQFPNVRKLIYENRFDDANAVLDSVAAEKRNAEWNFLKGAVYYRRGWLEQSFKHFEAAVNMDPGNSEFKAAYNQASNMRGGSSGGYKARGNGGCSPCSTCCGLMCADQCCECFGGDFISCC